MTGDDRLRAATPVVVNWHSHELTTRCGAALLGDVLPPERLVLVDNGSSDDSAVNRGAAAQHAETHCLGHFVRAAALSTAGRHDRASCSLGAAKTCWPLRRPG